MNLFKSLIFLLLVGISGISFAQQNHRFKANVIIKEKMPDGKFNLTKGTLYYDINTRKAVYDITFPEKAIVIITDTAYISIKNGKRTSVKSMKEFLDFSLYNLCLTGKLDYYGLKGSPYTISKTEKQDSMVITTWSPPAKMKKKKGVIKVSIVNKKLFGVILYDPKGTIISKQFFEEYVNVKNLMVPGKVISFFFIGKEKSTQITEFKNIVINEVGNNTMYDHALE